uniref:RxLR effector candidate protein n=1 Tax=Hyaloperonospora arabidopsidis (strain Emoy2) TaxID=559515 RepID=M4C4W8_HYAAE
MDFSEVLLQPETFYVVDGVRPSLYVAKTILVTSPRTEIWKKYDQESCKRLYMPVWTQEEIFRCRQLMYSNTPVEIVEDRYLKWGGIARYVLRYAMDSEKQEELDQAIAKADLKMILSVSVESSGVESDFCHRLLHFRVNWKTLRNEAFDFGSVYIAQKVFATLYKRTRRDLIDFIAASHQLSDFAGERGIFFERLALSMLSQGGSFEARRLTKEGKDYVTGGDEDESKSECVGDDDGGVTMDNRAAFEHVKLRPRKTLFFSQDSEVTNADSDTFLQPASRNFESVDALAKPNELFQVTCARVHPCKQNGLLKALSLLGNPVAPRLYFVVPPDVFEGFKYQDYHTVRGGKVKVVDEKLKKLEQYVIKIDYDYEIRLANDFVEKSINLRVEEGQESSVQSRMSKRSKTANV